MKGVQIYLTRREQLALLNAVSCYIEMMEDGKETYNIVNEEITDGGLGRALYKISVETNSHHIYKDYK